MNKEYENNIRNILQLVQMKHLKCFDDWGINRRVKSEAINGLIKIIKSDSEKLEYFKHWLSTFTIDGHNNYYVFNYKGAIKFENIEEILKNLTVESLLDMDTSNIDTTSIIYSKYDHLNDRLIFRFISPALISIKTDDGNGFSEYSLEETFYFATVYLDFKLNQIIVSIPHTTGIRTVDGIESKSRDFSKIAQYYVSKLKLILPNCKIDIESCDDWIYSALYELAEEGSYHNNPIINEKYEDNKSKISDFSKQLMYDSGISDKAIIENFTEGISILYENMLREEFGVIEDETQYSTFIQNGDGGNSFCTVGSKTNNLKSGRAHAIAKTSRDTADVKNLGVMKSFNGTLSRFLIEILSNDMYVVKTDTSKFIEERVIYDVIRKVGEYKHSFRRCQ